MEDETKQYSVVPELATYSWQELLNMHKFYMFAPTANKQAQTMLGLIEYELSERACKSADAKANVKFKH